jgi:Reverse transcriptase (RNA-dependent DNA polymerase)
MMVVFTRWVFVLKLSPTGNRFKACFVACGCNQVPLRDYSDTFLPILDKDSFCIQLAIRRLRNMHMILMDVKCAFF